MNMKLFIIVNFCISSSLFSMNPSKEGTIQQIAQSTLTESELSSLDCDCKELVLLERAKKYFQACADEPTRYQHLLSMVLCQSVDFVKAGIALRDSLGNSYFSQDYLNRALFELADQNKGVERDCKVAEILMKAGASPDYKKTFYQIGYSNYKEGTTNARILARGQLKEFLS